MTSEALERKAQREATLVLTAKAIRELIDEARETYAAVGGNVDTFEDEVLELVTGEDEEDGE